MTTTATARPLGRSAAIDHGPGGGKCPCCGDAPGRRRKAARRTARRREAQALRSEVW